MVYVLSNPSDHIKRLLDYLKLISDARLQAEVERYTRDDPSSHNFCLLDYRKDSSDTTLRAEQERYVRDDPYALECS